MTPTGHNLTERVIPDEARQEKVSKHEATKSLLLKALDGHGWATTKTLVDTWRLTKARACKTQVLKTLLLRVVRAHPIARGDPQKPFTRNEQVVYLLRGDGRRVTGS